MKPYQFDRVASKDEELTMTKLRIIRTWDDHEPVVLGLVCTEKSESSALADIDELWTKFQNIPNDTDTEFIKYLTRTGHYHEIEDDFIDVCVNW